MYSVVSNSTYMRLGKLAEICGRDIGNRGVEDLKVEGDFEKSCLALSQAKNIALTTGFPVNDSPYDETDGLPGSLFLFTNNCLYCIVKLKIIFGNHNKTF